MCEVVAAFPHTSKFRDFHLTLLSAPPGLTFNKYYFMSTLYVCIYFIRISEQTAINSLYGINLLVFYNQDGASLLRGTAWIFIYTSGFCCSSEGWLFEIYKYSTFILVHSEAQLFEALRYKPEGSGFDSRCLHWNFSLTSFRPHYDSGVHLASNKN